MRDILQDCSSTFEGVFDSIRQFGKTEGYLEAEGPAAAEYLEEISQMSDRTVEIATQLIRELITYSMLVTEQAAAKGPEFNWRPLYDALPCVG